MTLKELLKRWAKVDPEYCQQMNFAKGNRLAFAVSKDGWYINANTSSEKTLAHNKALIFSGVVESILSRGWEYSIRAGKGRVHAELYHREEASEGGFFPYEESVASNYTEALLMVLLKVLERQ